MNGKDESHAPGQALDIRDVARSRLFFWMKARGWTQRTMAERMGVSEALITKIKKGRQNMTMETVMQASTALDLSWSEFLHDEPPSLNETLARVPPDVRAALEAIISRIENN